MEEEHSQLRREHKDKCREHDQLKRLAARLKDELAVIRTELEERDRLIAEKGLVIVGEAVPSDEEEQTVGDSSLNNCSSPRKALVSMENAQLLENAGEGSLGNSNKILHHLLKLVSCSISIAASRSIRNSINNIHNSKVGCLLYISKNRLFN